jgi:hypothetical protein
VLASFLDNIFKFKKAKERSLSPQLTPQSGENPPPPFIMPPWRGKKRKSPNKHGTRSILDIFPARARIADTTVATQTSADLAPRLDIEPFFSEAAAHARRDSATKKQPCRSTKTKQPVDYCESDLESEDDGDKATGSDSDEYKLGHNTDDEDESIEGDDEEVPNASNLVDEDAAYEEEREKVSEAELCRLEKQLETNAIANLNKCNSIGLNSARKVKDHFFDTHIPYDKTALLVEAIKLFNALSPEEKERKKGKNKSHPFYVFAAIDIQREFPGLTTDKIEQLDPDVIISKVGILVKAWSKERGDNSVKILCGGDRNKMKSGFYRRGFFLLQVVHTPEKFIQFATSVEIDGGRARVATLKRSAFLHDTSNPAFILLREATEGDSPVGDVLAKFGSISQAVLAIRTSNGSITKSNLRKEGGVTISRFNLTHYPESCIETFLDIPMFEDHEERFATLMDERIVEICRPGVLLSQVSYSDLIADNESHLDDDDGWAEIKVKSRPFICLNDLVKRIKEKEIFAVNKIKQGNGKQMTVSESLIRTAMNCNNGTSHGGLFTERIFREKGPQATDKKWGRGTDGKWIWTLTDNRLFLSQNKTFFERGEDNHYHEI